MVGQLKLLDMQVWPSVELQHLNQKLVEYDAVGIRHYQCFVFEVKRRSDFRQREAVKKEILLDLLKLYQVQQRFGGPFGKAYWVFSGDYELSEVEAERIRLFNITLIRGDEVNRLASEPDKFDLPNRKPKAK